MGRKFVSVVFSFLMVTFMIGRVEGVRFGGSSPREKRYSVEKKEAKSSPEAVVPVEKPEVVTKPKVEKETNNGTVLIFVIIVGALLGWIYLRPSKKKKKENKTK